MFNIGERIKYSTVLLIINAAIHKDTRNLYFYSIFAKYIQLQNSTYTMNVNLYGGTDGKIFPTAFMHGSLMYLQKVPEHKRDTFYVLITTHFGDSSVTCATVRGKGSPGILTISYWENPSPSLLYN